MMSLAHYPWRSYQHMNYYPPSMYGEVFLDKFTYIWRIYGFVNILNTFENTMPLNSPVFPIGTSAGSKWRVLIYPNGENPECADFISVFLAIQPGHPPTTVGFTLSFFDIENNLLVTRGMDNQTFRADSNRVYWGFRDFLSTAEVREMLKNPKLRNILTIRCEIDYKTGRQDEAPQFFSSMGKLLDSGRFSDITLICQGKKFRAHKNVLAARSPVFSAMFEHSMRETREKVVEIPDIDPETMKELLKFMYSNKVDNPEENACGLLVAANKYEIEELMGICQTLLYENLTVENAVDILILADVYNAKILKSKALRFLIDNLTEVSSTPGYGKLGQSHWHIVQEILAIMAVRQSEVNELKKELQNLKICTADDLIF